MSLVLPNDDGRCSGTYQMNTEGLGTWAMACTNGLNASGTMKASGNSKISEGQGTDIDGRKVRLTVGAAVN